MKLSFSRPFPFQVGVPTPSQDSELMKNWLFHCLSVIDLRIENKGEIVTEIQDLNSFATAKSIFVYPAKNSWKFNIKKI